VSVLPRNPHSSVNVTSGNGITDAGAVAGTSHWYHPTLRELLLGWNGCGCGTTALAGKPLRKVGCKSWTWRRVSEDGAAAVAMVFLLTDGLLQRCNI
jgi:hypothetical protein